MGKMTAAGTTIEEDGFEYLNGQVVDNFRNRRVDDMKRKGWPERAIQRFIETHDDHEDNKSLRPAL